MEWTVHDYLHWLPAYQASVQAAQNRRSLDLSEKRNQQDEIQAARRFELDRQVEDRLQKAAELERKETEMRPQRQMAVGLGSEEAWQPAMGPLTQSDTAIRQTPEYLGARAAENAARMRFEAQQQAELERDKVRYPQIQPGSQPRYFRDPNGNLWLLADNPRLAPMRVPEPMTARPLTTPAGQTLGGAYVVGNRVYEPNLINQMAAELIGQPVSVPPSAPAVPQAPQATVAEEVLEFDPASRSIR